MKSSQDSVARLFDESRAHLRRFVRRLVKHPETTEEIMQEAYLRTYQHANSLEVPRAFLFSTARNLAIDTIRLERARKFESIDDLKQLHSLSQSAEELALIDEQHSILQEAMTFMTSQSREAFKLRFFHAHSYKEIAKRLNISPRTVECHIARGLRSATDFLQHRYRITVEKRGAGPL